MIKPMIFIPIQSKIMPKDTPPLTASDLLSTTAPDDHPREEKGLQHSCTEKKQFFYRRNKQNMIIMIIVGCSWYLWKYSFLKNCSILDDMHESHIYLPHSFLAFPIAFFGSRSPPDHMWPLGHRSHQQAQPEVRLHETGQPGGFGQGGLL